MIKLVYCAAPYRAKTGWGIDQNIQRARELGAQVAEMGAMPVVPHANTAHYDGLQDDQFWLEGTLELMRRCDAILMSSDWERSMGARGEHAEAVRRGMPVFYALSELREWLTGQ